MNKTMAKRDSELMNTAWYQFEVNKYSSDKSSDDTCMSITPITAENFSMSIHINLVWFMFYNCLLFDEK